MDQPKPTRRTLDMAPRRMDGFARPMGPQPARPAAAPQPQPAPRPVAPAPRPQQPIARPAARPAYRQPEMPARPAPAPMPAPAAQTGRPAEKPQGGGWKIAIQFILGLMVIAGVAATIVWLYLKYYTQ